MIQICDSKKKGDYSIKNVSSNGKCTADHSGFSSPLAVVKNIMSNANTYKTRYVESVSILNVAFLFRALDVRDCTKSQYFAQKFGCKKYVVKSKTK